ncbi:MAG: hypothetical protein DRG11_00635 [Epsilonproteobacteria bacterium]|nr:MAG: hypothetical protein DRG11_00635 [Campylobacterota bacterium]
MKKIVFILLFVCLSLNAVELKSSLNFQQTVDSIQKAIKTNGYKIYATINHKANAKTKGAYSNNSVVIVFDNPQDTARIMMHDSKVAFDLPQKVMIYEDLDDDVLVKYKKYSDLQNSYDVKNCMILDSITNKIDTMIKKAVKK